MTFEKFLSKRLFMVAAFLQVNWYNPYFLDKTGHAMAETVGLLKDWKGDPSGFAFNHEYGNYAGTASIQRMWIQWRMDDVFDADTIKVILSDFNEVTDRLQASYQPKHFSRIGVRIQAIYSTIDAPLINRFNSFSSAIFPPVEEDENVRTQELISEFHEKDTAIRSAISLVARSTNEGPGPERGILFDLDFGREYKNLPTVELVGSAQEHFTFVADRYMKTLSRLLHGVRGTTEHESE